LSLHLFVHLFFSILPPPPTSTLFPYTTLFRSAAWEPEGSIPQFSWLCFFRCLSPHSLSLRRWHKIFLRSISAHTMRMRGTGSYSDRKSTRLNSSHVAIS